MVVRSLVVGPLEENCFIIADEESKKAMVIDPGDEPGRIMEIIRNDGLSVDYIVCTHAHFDHIGVVGEIQQGTGAKIVVHKSELELYHSAKDQAAFWGYDVEPLPEPDMFVAEGDVIRLGSLAFKVIHTPGHSPGGICLFGEGLVITGDTLFAGSVGRTDFYGGDIVKLKRSFERLMSLSAATEVLSGHGPASTIGKEQSGNLSFRTSETEE